MTENSTPDDRTPDDRTPDEKAVVALFASLVEGSSASELSPLDVVRLGRIEVRGSIDTRLRRRKVVRNLVVAAALVAAVVLVLPRLGNSSSDTTAASVGVNSAPGAAPAAAPAASSSSAAGAFAEAGSASAPSSAGSAAPMSSEAASAAPRVPGRTAAGAGTADGAASPGAASSAMSSGALTSGAPTSAAASSAPSASSSSPAIPPATNPSPSPLSTISGSNGDGRCVSLSAAAVQAARATFPAGYFGRAAAPTGCTSSGVVLPASADPSSSVSLNVRKAKPGACVLPDEGAPCSKTSSSDAFALTSFGTESDIWVYGRGYEVYLRVSGTFPEKVTPEQLTKAGRAVIRALG